MEILNLFLQFQNKTQSIQHYEVISPCTYELIIEPRPPMISRLGFVYFFNSTDYANIQRQSAAQGQLFKINASTSLVLFMIYMVYAQIATQYKYHQGSLLTNTLLLVSNKQENDFNHMHLRHSIVQCAKFEIRDVYKDNYLII